jgi:hypothetical protein
MQSRGVDGDDDRPLPMVLCQVRGIIDLERFPSSFVDGAAEWIQCYCR